MKKNILVSLFVFFLILTGCKEQGLITETDFNSGNGQTKLEKKDWVSTSKDWPFSQATAGQNCFTWDKADGNLAVSFVGYSFSFTKASDLMGPGSYFIYVRVNGSLVATIDNSSSSKSFTYDGLNMEATVFKRTTSVYNSCNGQSATIVEPSGVEVRVETYVNPDTPTGFSVSPRLHDNLNQDVTISWTASSDTDVTGYQIYRKLDGQSSFSLIHTINSRTTSSWIDTSVPWSWGSGSDMGAAFYKVRAVDGTNNLYSNFTISAISALTDWAI